MNTRASAARYARALFDVALAEGDPERVDRELSALSDLVARTPDLQRVFESPAVPAAAKQRVLEQLLPRFELSPPLAKLLLRLAGRDRLSLVRDLADLYRVRLMEHQRVVRAEVTTAAPRSADEAARVEKRLAEATGGRVLMTTRVDPSIVGGTIARVGGVVYDGSIASQLQRIRERLEETR
jgi:F-type H+-transporting ATPase subunit delta